MAKFNSFGDLAKAMGVQGDEPRNDEVVTTPAETTPDTPTYTESQLEMGVLFLEVFGPKRAPKVLEKELPSSRGYGYGRAMGALREQFEAAIRGRPATEADTLRQRLNDLAMMRASKARAFDEAIELAHEVVVTGAAARALKERQAAVAALTTGTLAPPAMPRWSDYAPLNSYGRQEAVETWYRTFDDWYRALTPPQQRAFGKEPWQLREQCATTLNDAARRDVEQQLSATLSAFRNGGESSVFVTEVNRLDELQTGADVSGAMLREPRVWELIGQELRCHPYKVTPEYIQVAPTAQALHGLSLAQLVSLRMKCKEEFRATVQTSVERALPYLEAGQVYFEAGAVFTADAQMYTAKDGPASNGAYPIEPKAGGWFILGQSRYQNELPEARWVTPELAELVLRLPTESDGTCLLTKEVVTAFNRHDQHGYPRLNWSVKAGSNRRWFELPIQRNPNSEGPLVARIEALKDLLDAGLEALIPPAAWWVEACIGQTQRGAPRLDMGPTTQRGTLIVRTGSSMSRGRHGSEGSTVGAAKGPKQEAKVLWSGFACSNGGGLASSCLVAWIPEGATLVLDSGAGLKFEGGALKLVTGAGLDPADDPTR